MRPITETDRIIRNSEKEHTIYWSPVWAGVLTAIIIGLLFNLLGTAIGFSIFLPKQEVLWPLSIGAITWLVLSGIVSLYTAGWVAGRFSNARTTTAAVLYGILVSAISTIISLAIMVSTLGSVLSSSFSVLGNIASVSTSAFTGGASLLNKGLKEVSEWSPELTDKVRKAVDLPDLKALTDKVNQELDSLLPKTESNNNEVSIEKIKSQLWKLIKASQEINKEEIRNKLIDTLVQQTGKSREEVEEVLNNWQERYNDIKEKAYEAAMNSSKKVAGILAQAALANFFILLSGVLAAVFGALYGTRNKYE